MSNYANHILECNDVSNVMSESITSSFVFFYGNIKSKSSNFSDLKGSGIHPGSYPLYYDISYSNIFNCNSLNIYDVSDTNSGNNKFVNIVNNSAKGTLLYFYTRYHAISDFVIKNNTYVNFVYYESSCTFGNIFVDVKLNNNGFIQKITKTYEISIQNINISFDYQTVCLKNSNIRNIYFNYNFLFLIMFAIYIE